MLDYLIWDTVKHENVTLKTINIIWKSTQVKQLLKTSENTD